MLCFVVLTGIGSPGGGVDQLIPGGAAGSRTVLPRAWDLLHCCGHQRTFWVNSSLSACATKSELLM